MNSNASKHIVLDSLRFAYEKTIAGSDILDGKLQMLLNYSSVAVSIATSVMASTLLNQVGMIFWLIIAFAVGLYVALFLVVMNGMKPRSFFLPVSTNYETIEEQYFNKSESDALEQAIMDHVHFRKLIESENNDFKARAFTKAFWLMGFMVFSLVIAVPVGLLLPSPTLPQLIANWIH